MRHHISAESFYENISGLLKVQFEGCYSVIALEVSDRPRPIQRLLGVDPSGVLYIGASKTLPNRMGSLKKAVWAAYGWKPYVDVSPHMVGRKIAVIDGFTTAFPLESLIVEFEHCPVISDESSRPGFDKEDQRLRDYRRRFGETPPLNG